MKIIYRADDGKEFKSSAECERHENAIKLTDVIPGAQFAYGGEVLTIIRVWDEKYWLGGRGKNTHDSFSGSARDRQGILEYLQQWQYRKVS